MDDFGDYIYIILLAVASIIGFLKKKKPVEKPKMVSSQKTWEEKMRDLEQSLSTKKTIEEPIIEEIEESPYLLKDKIPVQVIEEPFIDSSVQDLESTPFMEPKVPSDIQIEEIDSLEKEKNIWEMHTPEDARKAFVYAEIFNRKY